MNMIEARNLTKTFGGTTAVDRLNFEVAEGEVFGLLGPNGAGKTTTIRMLCGLIAHTRGEARIGGHPIGRGPDALALRKLIGLVPDNIGLYEELSAVENLDYYGQLYECPLPVRREKMEYYLTRLNLWDQRDQPVSGFSKGMKQKVAIARALIHDPQLLVFDEPTANLDPESARVVREFILKLKKEGKTILINTHNLDEARRICDRIGILRTTLLAVNSPAQLERSVWGSRTMIQVEQMTEAIVAAVRALDPQDCTLEGNQLLLTLTDPQAENPRYVQAVVAAGGRVQYVTALNPGLEETYLKIIQEAK